MIHYSVLLLIGLVGLLMIGGAMATGWLVFRAKRESHESLYPAARGKGSGGPVVVDEFAEDDKEDEQASIPESVKMQNQVFGAQFSAEGMRNEQREIRAAFEREQAAKAEVDKQKG